jgi:phospholipid transport system substrate-binding protein
MVRVAATLAFLLFALSRASAETWPTEALQEVFAQANEILTDPRSEDRPLDRLMAIRKLVNDAFDFKGAAELASGDHWQARTAAEQEEFTWLFSDLLERAFVSQMLSKASLTGGTRIRYLDEWLEGDTAVVQTALARRNGGELLLDYHLVERGGAWKIRDVIIDGVSLMANYRSQLDRVLGNASFGELLSQMRAKVGVVDPPPADATTTEEVAPPKEVALPIQLVAVAEMPLPRPDRLLVTFEPAIEVPAVAEPPIVVAIREPAAPPADEPMTPPAMALPRPAAMPQATTRAYWLRMMAGGTPEEAGRLVSRLRAGKLPISIDRQNGGRRLLVSVRVGPFRNAEEAVLTLLDLQAKGHNPYLVAERN